MSKTDPKGDATLEALFEAGRADRAAPTPDFMARLAADAEAAMPKPASAVPKPMPRRTNWLAGIFTASGLSGAAVLGIWIGFAMPETFDTFALTADNSVALSTFLPGADLGAFDE